MISLLVHYMSVVQKVKRYGKSEKTRKFHQFENIEGRESKQTHSTGSATTRTKHHPSPHQNCMWRIESFFLVLVGISFMFLSLLGNGTQPISFWRFVHFRYGWLQIFYRIRREEKYATKITTIPFFFNRVSKRCAFNFKKGQCCIPPTPVKL